MHTYIIHIYPSVKMRRQFLGHNFKNEQIPYFEIIKFTHQTFFHYFKEN